jgi:hypothetical protein
MNSVLEKNIRPCQTITMKDSKGRISDIVLENSGFKVGDEIVIEFWDSYTIDPTPPILRIKTEVMAKHEYDV